MDDTERLCRIAAHLADVVGDDLTTQEEGIGELLMPEFLVKEANPEKGWRFAPGPVFNAYRGKRGGAF